MDNPMTPGTQRAEFVVVQQRSPGTLRFDWIAIMLSCWLLGGAFLDGWAHTHNKVDTSFFTPWHAVFYAGYLAVASYLVGHVLLAMARGVAWRLAIPAGYRIALLGVVLFWIGGVSDVLWHSLFGIEQNVNALLSPPHLLLAGGVWLMVSGPFHAAWQRTDTAALGWARLGPGLLSLTCMLSTGTFILQIAHPVANLWGAGIPPKPTWLFEEMGVVSFLCDTGMFMGMIFVALRRWTLPPGALTLVLSLNALAMSVVYYQGYPPLLHILARGFAGLLADLLLYWLKPSMVQPRALRLFAFAVPLIVTTLYFLAAQITVGIWWSIHLWMGTIVLTGVVGLLLSYLVLPPPLPSQALADQPAES